MKIAHHNLKKKSLYLYFIFITISLLPLVTAPIALFLGLLFALTNKNPFPNFNKLISRYLLQVSIVGLGFGMNVHESLKTGGNGIVFTIISVVSVMFIGVFIGKYFKIDKITSYLISSGTAICGGSAIAAVSPLTKADQNQISISLATIFILNAVGLFIFPLFGKLLDLTQHQFGVWSAIAIHDTSSVVGAATTYGNEALQVATTVKLTRALWIIPLSLATAMIFKNKDEKLQIPWFILLFIVAMLINSYFQLPKILTSNIAYLSQRLLILTLFFIGAGLSRTSIAKVGIKPLLLALFLWCFITITSLVFILKFY